MKTLRIFLLVLLFPLISGCSGKVVEAVPGLSVVPLPESVSIGDGVFRLTPEADVSLVSVEPEMDNVAAALRRVLASVFGRSLDMVLYCGADVIPEPDTCGLDGKQYPGRSLICVGTDPSLPCSGYRLDITPKRIEITGGDAAGCFYAVQTLLQLIPPVAYDGGRIAAVELPAMTVTDSPAMEYRGMMLDVARHFFTADEVKKVLDIMALHKLNVFHWHLTDDQGWRIESSMYPELMRVGSIRKRTIIGKDPGGEYDESTRYDETPHGGYYTAGQMREIVDYAAARFITVIPEVEFPGHAVAALASYPWLGCTGEQYEVRQTWDIDDRVFCIGRESTFEFMQNILSEVMEIFPSEYIHIGGDECPDKMWRQCPECIARMEKEGLDTFRALQGYGVARLGDFVESHGRHLIGWDEILDAGVTRSSAVMSWRGTEGGVKAARQGNKVIMCPTEYCYFDYYQSPDIENEPLAWGGLVTLDKAYSFDPYQGLDSLAVSNVLGVQANLWTEYISDIDGLEYMMLPRLAALAETAWSHGRKDWDNFSDRMDNMYSLYDVYGYVYAHSAQNEE